MNIYLYVICGMFGSFLLCIGLILLYVKYRKNILQKQYQLKATEVQYQKDLLKAVINSQEEERKRIGMDLHDEVGSKLSLLRLIIETFTDKNTEALSAPQFSQKCKSTIDEVINNVRNISHNLSPILQGVYELLDALEDFCDELNRSGKIHIAINVEPTAENIRLEHFTKLSLYRVITELVNNTIKHAEAKNVSIDFSLTDNIYSILFADDGKGLQENTAAVKKGIGFKNMESRLDSIGAEYNIRSQEGRGFEMRIDLPVKQL